MEGTNNFRHPNSGFAQRVETTVHGVPHTFIGGQMISYESVFDPMFLGHHSMIENTFTMWQDCKNLEIRSTLKVSYPATTPRPGTPPPVPVPRSQPRNCTCHAGPDEPVRRKWPTHRFQRRVDRYLESGGVRQRDQGHLEAPDAGPVRLAGPARASAMEQAHHRPLRPHQQFRLHRSSGKIGDRPHHGAYFRQVRSTCLPLRLLLLPATIVQR